MNELVVVAKDRVGLLADITSLLNKSGIEVKSSEVKLAGEEVVINLSISDVERGKKVLESANYKIKFP